MREKRNDGKEVKGWAMGGRIAEGKQRDGRGRKGTCLAWPLLTKF